MDTTTEERIAALAKVAREPDAGYVGLVPRVRWRDVADDLEVLLARVACVDDSARARAVAEAEREVIARAVALIAANPDASYDDKDEAALRAAVSALARAKGGE